MGINVGRTWARAQGATGLYPSPALLESALDAGAHTHIEDGPSVCGRASQVRVTAGRGAQTG